MTVSIHQQSDPTGTERVLRSLPNWFGIEEAIQSYVDMATRLESHIATINGETVGVALVERHFAESAELALIAVHAEHRTSGIGRRLVESVEKSIQNDGCRFLEVHTVGPSYQDEGYAATRAFYQAVGFTPMHEFEKLDWDGPTLILIKSLSPI
ncbi:MAG: GNAT family N-acetyltransferase [Microbacterium sp.]|uniref:GNAT family N-acetyltransferase n=1 Tax=Microbacterium sp. TaxID=51671 RepID=UPI003A86AA93